MRCTLSLLPLLLLCACTTEAPPELLPSGENLPLCSLGPGPTVNAASDPGDWQEREPYAACGSHRYGHGTCGEVSNFSVAGCDLTTLAQLGTEGTFVLQLRRSGHLCVDYEDEALHLSASGPQWLAGGRVSSSQVGSGGLHVKGGPPGNGVTTRTTLLGCAAVSPDEFVGCYQKCREGTLTAWGTFRAVRAGPRPTESEALGLTKVAEAPPMSLRYSSEPHPIPTDVYVTKAHAYVTSLKGGLSVYDVSNPESPVLTQELRDLDLRNANANAVWGKGEALYVATGSGVSVFDLSDPAHPRFERQVIGTSPSNSQALHTVHVDGDLLFAAADRDGNVVIFDISSPLHPVLRADYRIPGLDPQRFYGPHDMRAFEGRLYVNGWNFGLYVVDLTDPSQPLTLGHYTYPNATSHATALGRFGERVIAFEGGEQWGAHLRVLDVTEPASIRLIGQYSFDRPVSIHNLELVGTRLYVAHYQAGLRVLDVSVPETPREVAHYNTFRESDPWRGELFYDGAIGVRVPGDGYVYAVDTSRGLLVLREN